MKIKCDGMTNAYRMCRGLNLGRLHSAYRAVRFLLTRRTGPYKVDLSRGFKVPPEQIAATDNPAISLLLIKEQ